LNLKYLLDNRGALEYDASQNWLTLGHWEVKCMVANVAIRYLVKLAIASIGSWIVVGTTAVQGFASCPPNGAPGLNPPPPPPNARYYSDYVTHYWDGWYRNLSNAEAINGNILATDPWVDPPDSADFSSSWVMLTGGSSYAQVGWMKYASEQNTGSFIFAEEGGPSTTGPWFYRTTYNTVSPGSTYPFMVQNNVRQGWIDYYAGGNLVRSDGPFFTASQGQEYGEIVTKSSEMPGWSGGEQFTSTQIYSPATGWLNYSGSVTVTNGNFFGAGTDGVTHTWIWDWYCSY
jgi:hypothetical protein